MIRRPTKLSIIISATLALTACNSTDKESESSPKGDETSAESSEGTDEPAWVNAMYLTCNWNSIESQSQVGVACSVNSKDPAYDPATAGLSEKAWRVMDNEGKNIGAEKKQDGGKNIFVLDAKSVIALSTQAVMSDGSFDKIIQTRFEDLLEGLEKGGKLEACFNAEVGISDCFEALGIKIPTGDRIRNADAVKPEESACANKETLPEGVPCEISSDGFSGDFDQAREWFRDGHDLISEDGSVKSADFCDAGGVKPVSPKGSTNTKTRWYPYWKDGSRPCFASFNPEGPATPWHNKYLAYNTADGKEGEPFCMFAIMAEPTVFGGRIHRMHIFKNPKLFPDAANSQALSREALQAFTEHFSCK